MNGLQEIPRIAAVWPNHTYVINFELKNKKNNQLNHVCIKKLKQHYASHLSDC